MLVDDTKMKNIFLVYSKSDLLSGIPDNMSHSDFFIIPTFSMESNIKDF